MLRGFSTLLLAIVLPCVGLISVVSFADAGLVLREGHPGEPDSLDPHRAISAPALVVTNDLFEGLMTLDARGRPVTGCAERYAVSADGKTYTFQLRSGLQWSDGSPLNANDFVYSLRRLADPATATTALASYIDLIAGGAAVLARKAPPDTLGVSAPDARTVRISLTHPAPYFLTVVALPAFAPVPRQPIERHGREWTRPEHFIGNGPFVLSQWRPGDYIKVTRNSHFHDAKNVHLDAVVYKAIADLNTGLRLFQDGELDTLTNFPPEKLDWLRANMPQELHLSPSLGVTVYAFNFRLPKFRDLRVRRALSLAIDRELLTTRVIHSGDLPADGIVPAALPGFESQLRPASSPMATRVAQARALLAQAGYGPAHPLTVEILHHTSEEHKKIALAVAAMWQQIGVQTTLRNAERQIVDVAFRNGEFDIARAAWFSSFADPIGLLDMLRRASPANGGAYQNPKFDALLAQAETSLDDGARNRLLRDAQTELISDQATIPLYFIVSRRLIARRVGGWRDDNLTALRGARWLTVH